MKQFKRTFFKDFLETWNICGTECGACYYHGPIVPHNWLELPPHEWAPPSRKCPSFEYFKFKAYSGVGRGDLASIVHDDSCYPITEDLMHVMYTCTAQHVYEGAKFTLTATPFLVRNFEKGTTA
jgi:hypothetical protein